MMRHDFGRITVSDDGKVACKNCGHEAHYTDAYHGECKEADVIAKLKKQSEEIESTEYDSVKDNDNHDTAGCATKLDNLGHQKIDGNTSDGYHTFNELYHHRAVLFATICNQNKHIAWKSKKHSDGTMFENMFIVGIETPQGQATYHYYIEPYWDYFKVKELGNAPIWDGHTPAQAIERIKELPNINCRKQSDTVKEFVEKLSEKMYCTMDSFVLKDTYTKGRIYGMLHLIKMADDIAKEYNADPSAK